MRIHIFYLPESFFDLFFSVFIHQIVRYLMNKDEEKDRKKRKDDLIVFFIGKFKQILSKRLFIQYIFFHSGNIIQIILKILFMIFFFR